MDVFKRASEKVDQIIREEITEPERREREEAQRRAQERKDGQR